MLVGPHQHSVPIAAQEEAEHESGSPPRTEGTMNKYGKSFLRRVSHAGVGC